MNEREDLKKLLKDSLVFKEVILSSGKKSNFYLDGKMISLDPVGSLLIARLLLDMLKEKEIEAIGGLTIGADPIAASTATLSQIEGNPVKAFIVRKDEKKHGQRKRIEGPLSKNMSVAIIDDVVTSGASLIAAAQAVEQFGAKISLTTALVDRGEGAREAIEAKGYVFKPLFHIKELL